MAIARTVENGTGRGIGSGVGEVVASVRRAGGDPSAGLLPVATGAGRA